VFSRLHDQGFRALGFDPGQFDEIVKGKVGEIVA